MWWSSWCLSHCKLKPNIASLLVVHMGTELRSLRQSWRYTFSTQPHLLESMPLKITEHHHPQPPLPSQQQQQFWVPDGINWQPTQAKLAQSHVELITHNADLFSTTAGWRYSNVGSSSELMLYFTVRRLLTTHQKAFAKCKRVHPPLSVF